MLNFNLRETTTIMAFFEIVKAILEFNNLNAEFFCDTKWASTYSEHRLNLRRHVYKKTKNKSVLNLNERPKLPDQFISISHCPKMGGFVISKEKVGLDLEQHQRLSLNSIRRVATESEIERFDDHHYPLIWTIKESVFKCGSGVDVPMSKVSILDFKINSISNQKIEDENKKNLNTTEIQFVKVSAQFQQIKYDVYSFISQADDVCMSLAFENKIS